MKSSPFTFKVASEAWEFEQINRLNYQTFVEEIPQHPANPEGILCDRFHNENTYVIALCDEHVEGMIAVRARRPFSLDAKLPQLDSYLPPGCSVCEIRLLAVRRSRRHGIILRGLVALLAQHCRQQGYDLAVIPGTVRQQKLYQHLGFVPFGPLVGAPGAEYQPMYSTLDAFVERSGIIFGLPSQPEDQGHGQPVNLLPGPVPIAPAVRVALAADPVSHRSPGFVEELENTKHALCDLSQAHSAEILVGTGTLANDVIAAQSSLEDGNGCILSNGEFGERLIDHADRFGLCYTALRADWGMIYERQRIEEVLSAHPVQWLWAVHCETSTGVLNDLDMLQAMCATHRVHLCLDCISSIGTVPLDLRSVYLASASSGKGLGSYPGLGIVFSDHDVAPAPHRLPRYLDLGLSTVNKGTPFTHSSNLVSALKVAVERLDHRHLARRSHLTAWLRAQLCHAGFQVVAPEAHASPAVTTIALPPQVSSECVGSRLANEGYWLSYQSHYLRERNWIQICMMSECSPEHIVPLPHLLIWLCSELGRG